MTKKKKIIIIAAVILLAGFIAYREYAVISCTNSAAENFGKRSYNSVLDYERAYNLILNVCLGRKGF